MKKISTLVFAVLISLSSFAQFLDKDVIMKVNGLSEVNANRFYEMKPVLINTLNKLDLPRSIKPLSLEVGFQSEKGGYIKLIVNFNVDSIYKEGTEYEMHGRNFSIYGKGVSFFFHHRLLQCISEYKLAVALNGYSLNRKLADFVSILTLKKKTGDAMNIYAYNEFNASGSIRGIFPYYFYNNIDFKVGGKIYSTTCGNSTTLDNQKMFFVTDLEELDGNKTGAYYFCKFYNVPTE